MKKSIFYLFVVFIFLASCGEYEKLLKSSDYALKYDKAFEYFEKEDYVRSATIFEQIANVYRGTTKADTINFYRAMSYYYSKDYVLAGHYFGELSVTYKNSEFAEEASYLNAYCFYKLSPRPSLDQDYTYKAINAFSLYLINYKGTDKREECLRIISEMREKLVEKSYLNARLYYDRGLYKAAIVALRNSLNDFPETNHREELMFLILQSNYLLAENSVLEKQRERYQDAVDEYYSFVAEFKEGQFAKEAKQIYENSMLILGLEIN
ncbi:MAG: outer membrane protein assembly factor BamD [Bacteroidales bacterium]|nr:outer membrane protein assembly factor BamD [Bacteroidales bacterium]MCF8391715.1 outer membrane protein assembly factor BamD [Bacteroidales bacterium]